VGPTVRCSVIDGVVCGLQLAAAIRFSSFYLGRGVRERWCRSPLPTGVGKPAHGGGTSSRGPSRSGDEDIPLGTIKIITCLAVGASS
jgi:hypothetical protein